MSTLSESTSAASRWRVLFDINVVMDVLAHREPHFHNSAEAWKFVETGEIEGYIAAHSFTTLHYLYSRQFSRDEAVVVIRKLLTVFKVASVDQEVISAALGYGWADFEDAVQMAAAQKEQCNYLVTRNLSDFKPSAVTVISPADLLTILRPR